MVVGGSFKQGQGSGMKACEVQQSESMHLRDQTELNGTSKQPVTSDNGLAAHCRSIQPSTVEATPPGIPGVFMSMPECSSHAGQQFSTQQVQAMQAIPLAGQAQMPSIQSFLISSELAMAKQRADKAAAGRRQSVALKRKLKAQGIQKKQQPSKTVKQEIAERADCEAMDDEALKKAVDNATDEKEAKRLKRLLRNRVSAQQARERRKVYVTDLESKVKAQEAQISELKQQIDQLQKDNQQLKQQLQGNAQSQFIADLLQPFDTDLMGENNSL